MQKQTSYYKLYTLILVLFSTLHACFANYVSYESTIHNEQPALTIATLYGKFLITEPVLIELITSPQMERLKGVRQLGVWYQSMKPYDYNRFDHSLGVWALVKKFNGSLQEQIAALVHDASHTAFSHVGSFFFVDSEKEMDAFQDDEHLNYLHASGLANILQSHGWSIDSINHKGNHFSILEQDLPDLCADRFEYNLQGALWEQLITEEEAAYIVDHVNYKDGIWYFTDIKAAGMIGIVSLIMTQKIWGSAENFLTGHWLGDGLRRAAQLQIISAHDVRFSTDDLVWNKLKRSNDSFIGSCIDKIENCRDYFTINDSDYHTIMYGKFRGINPLVLTENGLVRLTELNHYFAVKYKAVQATMNHGWHIALQ